MTVTHIFLDLDNCCADFNLNTARTVLHATERDITAEALAEELDSGATWADALGMSEHEVWKHINACGESWWVDMPEIADRFPACPRTMRLYDALKAIAPTTFLSAIPLNPDVPSAKLKWIQRIFGNRFNDVILCGRSNKKLMAATGCVLIDDYEKNCNEFSAELGSAVLLKPGMVTGIDQIVSAVRRAAKRPGKVIAL